MSTGTEPIPPPGPGECPEHLWQLTELVVRPYGGERPAGIDRVYTSNRCPATMTAGNGLDADDPYQV